MPVCESPKPRLRNLIPVQFSAGRYKNTSLTRGEYSAGFLNFRVCVIFATAAVNTNQRRSPVGYSGAYTLDIMGMYLFAKLFVALGFRRDLAALLQKSSAQLPLLRA